MVSSLPRATEVAKATRVKRSSAEPAVVRYLPTGEVIKSYRTLKGARVATARFNVNAGRQSYIATPV